MAARRRQLTWIAKTIPELAAAIDLSDRQICTHVARGMPRTSKGFSIPACVRWLRENVWRARPVSAPAEDPLMVAGDAIERRWGPMEDAHAG